MKHLKSRALITTALFLQTFCASAAALAVVVSAGCGNKGKTAEAVGKMSVQAVEDKSEQTTMDVPIEMIFVEGGTFTMGCAPEREGDCDDDGDSSRSVTVNNFQIGKYEVTQGLWQQIMGNNPSYFKGDDLLPVESVNWDDVQKFIEKLNEQTGKKYRLPTEAEWEYAARGGNKSNGYTYSGSDNIDEVAWYGCSMEITVSDEIVGYDSDGAATYAGNSGDRTHPVGTKRPNELGIYDMSGNVFEWAGDWYIFTPRRSKTESAEPPSSPAGIIRGGSWEQCNDNCRVWRSGLQYSLDMRWEVVGFRLALSP
jgi:formylglycine-generating enzyme required for sulfatase activity